MVTDFQKLVEALVDAGVDFVVVGGIALVLQGSARTTRDIDICYERSSDNLERLARALTPLHPTLRGAPPELPFLWDVQTLRSGLNFTLSCDAGDIDLLGEVTGLGDYATVAAHSEPLDLFGHSVMVLTVEGLERSKRAAGRAKDLIDLGDLAAIKERRGR